MGTVVEGEWDEVMALIRACHLEVLKSIPRLITTITIDDRPGKSDRITEKIRSVERRRARKSEVRCTQALLCKGDFKFCKNNY